jgi:glycosyltransferase involved in cell wall biosynthesis
MKTAAFSIVSPNYRHYARVLMASLAEQQPEWERFVLLVGGTTPADEREPFSIIPLDALPLPHRRQFCFRYTILELNTAVKPWMFAELFARGYERVVYFDPDIRVYSALAELDAADADTFLTLTPHLTGSIPGDEHPSERSILRAGAYNLGFLAAVQRPPLAGFLAWWQEKLELQCVVDVARGLFVDQKWLDLAPGMFPGVAILRHDGYNVAYWNLGQRTVDRSGAEITVNGAPLRFFHFSGYDPAHPRSVSKNDPRQTLDAAGDAARLIDDYGVALRAAGARTFRNAPYAYGVFADGTRIPDSARVAYRNSPELQAAAGDDPFAHPDLFRGYRDPRRTPLAAKTALYAYRALSRVRPLVTLLPKTFRRSAREFLLGRRESAPVVMHEATSLVAGLNIVGYLSRDTGVAESARLCRQACDEAQLPNQVIDIDDARVIAPHVAHRASIFHVNADQLPAVHEQLPQVFDASAYNIGCWHWELPELPDAWIASAEPLDEIWAPSAFIQSAVSRKVTIPVVHMPHGVEVTEIEACTAEELGVPRGRFTFLCMFDGDSVVERKNPFGAIEAFRRAFPRESHVALLIKTTNAGRHPELARALQEIPNVYWTDRLLSRARTNGLLSSCDTVVSLHRSEGFGLILAEAMDLGKPVIATAWSGNMDFMNGGNSCPVAYELVTLDRAYGPYAAGQQWAEPDVDDAAQLMRRIADDAEYRTRIGARARETIRSQFTPRAAGLRYRERLTRLGLL